MTTISPSIATPDADKDAGNCFLAVAALFEGYFSIDWMIELSDEKPSRVLYALEAEVERGVLSKIEHDRYQFSDSAEKKRFQKSLTAQEHTFWSRKIVDLLVRELPDDEQKVEFVADHMLNLQNDLDGCRWLMRTGDEQHSRHRMDKAIKYYAKVIEDLWDVHGDESDTLFMNAAIVYALAATGKEDNAQVVAIMENALGRAEAADNRPMIALIKIHQARTKWLGDCFDAALADFEAGWTIAKALDDPKLLHTAYTFIPYFFYWQGRFRDAVEAYEKVVPNVEKIPSGTFSKLAATVVGLCYVHIGQGTQGIGTIDAIRTNLLEGENPFYTAFADMAMGIAQINLGRFDDAIAYLADARDKSEKYGNYISRYISLIGLAYAYFRTADHKRSAAALKAFLAFRRKVDSFAHLGSYLLKIAWAMEEGDYPRVAGFSFESEFERMVNSGNRLTRGVALRYRSILDSREGRDKREILTALEESLAVLKTSGHQIECALTQLEMARVYLLAFDDRERAKAIAIEASQRLIPENEALIPDDLKSLIRDVRIQQDHFEEIMKLSQELVTLRNEKEVVQKIISSANRFTGAERGAIFLLEDDAGRPGNLYMRASKNITDVQVQQPEFAESMALLRDVAGTGKGRILETDTENREIFRPGRTIRSRICVPMVIRNQVMGVLYNDNRLMTKVFNEYELKVLSYFAAQAALALDNAMAYEHIEHLNKKLEEEKLYYEEQQMQQGHAGIIVGESAATQKFLSQLKHVAPSDTTVLLLGETGVGKDLAAQTVHRLSHRADGPYISVQCSALPDGLISSELFGHEKGAYTGAVKQRAGRFELADKGTLFLDEIGTLPMDTQIRLLRVLQSKEFERIGGGKTVESDFRLVTATNVDLEAEVRAGRFREDLFYRINVFPVYIPPLRERTGDIPLLAEHFLRKYAEKREKPAAFYQISDDDMRRLMAYDWKGNIRELENIIERGVILSTGRRFELPELAIGTDTRTTPTERLTLVENERRHILRALQETDWKVHGPGGAAEILDINPSTLVSRMRKHGIKRPNARKKKHN